MSKTQLQTNNEKLTALITELEGKAGGGGDGSLETCTVTFVSASSIPSPLSGTQTVFYTDANGQAKSEIWVPDETVITIIRGSFIVVTQWSVMSSQTNAVQLGIFGSSSNKGFQITDNSTFTHTS